MRWILFLICVFVGQMCFAQLYRPAATMQTGQIELKLFNSIYTQQRDYGTFGKRNDTYTSMYLQGLYGINHRVNIGLDVVAQSVTLRTDKGDFWTSLGFQNQESICPNGSLCSSQRAAAFSLIGPKVRFMPFEKIPNLSIQQTVFFPVQQKVGDNIILFPQIFYDLMFRTSTKLPMQIFVETSAWIPLDKQVDPSPFVKVFYSIFPGDKWTIYATASFLYEYGFGVKYRILPNFELEALHTRYIPGGDFKYAKTYTLNLGLRYVINQ